MARFSGTPIEQPTAGPRFGGTPVSLDSLLEPQQRVQAPSFDDPYLQDLMRLENAPLMGMKDTDLLSPNQAPELGGGQDFGFGHKIQQTELDEGNIYGIPIGQQMTVGDAKTILQKDLEKHRALVRKSVGGEVFDKLNSTAQNLLTDYSFTGVLDQFPKFREALVSGDLDTAEKEYVRYMTDPSGQKVPLGSRNTYTLAQLQKLRTEGQKQMPSLLEPQEAIAQTEQMGTEVPQQTSGFDIKKFLTEANPLGAIEGLASAATGIASSLPALGVGLGEVLQGTMAGDPVGGFASAQKEFEKVMEAGTYQSKTPGGQKIAEYVAMPFVEAEKGVEGLVRKAGGGDKEADAAKFAFNAFLFAAPALSGKVKSGKKLTKVEAAEVKAKVQEAAPDVPVSAIDEVLAKVKQEPDAKMEAPVAGVATNQHIVDALMEEANKRTGPKRLAYKSAAEKVAKWEQDAADADLGTISKTEGKLRKRIKELVEGRGKEEATPGAKPTDVDSAYKVLQDHPLYKRREELYKETNDLTTSTDGKMPPEENFAKARKLEAEINKLGKDINELPEFKDWYELYNKKGEELTQQILQNQEKNDLANKASWDEAPQHGTDIDALPGILSGGLKPGSALDYTPGKEWVGEYPIKVTVPSAIRGNKIEHNNFFQSGNTARAARVEVDLSHYVGDAVENVRSQIEQLQKDYPNVEFIVNEGKASKPRFQGTPVDRTAAVGSKMEAGMVEPPPLDLTRTVEPAKVLDLNDRLREAKTTKEALEIVKGETNPEFVPIIDRIVGVLEDSPFKLVENWEGLHPKVEGALRKAYGAQALGLSTERPHVWIVGKRLRENPNLHRTVVHEGLHAATTKKLTDGLKDVEGKTVEGRAAKELDALREQLAAEFEARREINSKIKMTKAQREAFKSPAELVTYGLLDGEFREFLKTIKIDGQSAFNKFVEKVRDLLGLDPKETNALTRLIELTDDLIEGAEPKKAREVEVARSEAIGSRPEAGMVEPPIGLEETLSRIAREREIREQVKRELEAPPEEIAGRADELGKREPTPEELAAEERMLEEDLAALEDSLAREQMAQDAGPVEGKAARKELLQQAYKQWRDSYVEKINTGKKAEGTAPIENPADLGTVKGGLRIFKKREDAEAYREAHGLEQDVITDPLTGESYLEPDMREIDGPDWREVDQYEDPTVIEDGYDGGVDFDLSDTGTRDLYDIFNRELVEESGPAPSLDELRIATDKLRELRAEAQRVGKPVGELLDSMGVSPELREKIVAQVERIDENARKLREADPIVEGILNPEGEIAYQRTKKNKKTGHVRTKVPMTVALKKTLLSAKKIPESGKLGSMLDAVEIRINRFERFSKELKTTFYDAWIKKLADSKREFRGIRRELKADLKGVSKEDRLKMSIVAHSRQKNGPELLARMGITEIPTLTPMQEALVQKYGDKLAKLRDRINYVRVKTGLRPLGKVDNYFTWAHKVNHMKDARILANEAAEFGPSFKGHSKEFKGSFFPYAERRGKKPTAIELDIFDGYEKYVAGALKEIHINPIAALAKEASNLIIVDKPRIRLGSTNPQLVKMLREWSDEILGIDPAYAGAATKMGKIAAWGEQRIHNLTLATLFGNVGTALKQPLALIGVVSETRLRDVMYGLGRTAVDIGKGPESTARQKSNVLEVRVMDLMFDEMAQNISKNGLAGVKKGAAELASWPMTFLDSMTAQAGWNAAYRYGKRKLKLDEAAAIQHADDVVTRTQGVGVRGAVSPIQASRITKWATLFQTFAINDFNYIARDLVGIRHPDIKRPEQVKRVLKYVAASMLANEVFSMMELDPPKPAPIQEYREAKKEGESKGAATGQALLELLEVVPLIGGAIKYESSALGAAGEFAKDIPEALRSTLGLIDWGSMTPGEKRKSVETIAETLGKYYGVPMTTQIKKSMRTASRSDDPLKILLGVYIEEGRKSKSGMPSLPPMPELPSLPTL
jgi:hypothetical protein